MKKVEIFFNKPLPKRPFCNRKSSSPINSYILSSICGKFKKSTKAPVCSVTTSSKPPAFLNPITGTFVSNASKTTFGKGSSLEVNKYKSAPALYKPISGVGSTNVKCAVYLGDSVLKK